MWNESTRARQAARSTPRKRYPSDLTDAEWEFIAPLLPKTALHGRHRVTDLRDVLNAIRYLVRRLRLAHAADPLSAVADGVLVVPSASAQLSVPGHS